MSALIRIVLRVLLPLILLYIIFKLIFPKKIFFRKKHREKRRNNSSVKNMRKDPVCGTYVPESEAKIVKSGGEQYYFCSDSCREKFIALKKSENNKSNSKKI